MSRAESDQQLVQRCQQGDLAAFNELYEKYRPQMYRLAVTILRNEHDAEDVVQDACVRIFKKIADYRGECKLKTWITTIVVNKAKDKLRSNKIRDYISLDYIFNRVGTDNVSADFDKLDDRRRLWKAVQQLDDKQRIPTILFCYLHYPCDEIATILKIPTTTVYSRLNTARGRLRRAVVHMKGITTIEFPYV